MNKYILILSVSLCALCTSIFSPLLSMQQPVQQKASTRLGILLFQIKDRTLVSSAAEGDESTALAALQLPGVNVNHQDGLGRTALHYAAQRNLKNLAMLLIAKNASRTIIDAEGSMPLALAVRYGNTDIAALLQPQ